MKILTNLQNLQNHLLTHTTEASIHTFLQQKGYIRVDVPVLSPALIPESHLEVFETEYRYGNEREKLYLIPAQELFMKRLLAYGIGDCYCLGKVFRNSERASDLHAGEFSMLEYYRTKTDYKKMAEEMRELLATVVTACTGKNSLEYQGKTIDFSMWEELTVAQAFETYATISQATLFDHEAFLKAAQAKGYSTEKSSYEDVFSQIYAHEIEPQLGTHGHPTILYDFPKEFAATAKLNPDGKSAQRFDVYIAGIEIGNCYSELTDPQETEKRFMAQYNKRKELGKIDYPIDKGFTEALKYGLVESSGATIGVDRLAMICANAHSIAQLRLITIT